MYYEPQRDIENRISYRAYANSSVQLHYHRSIELVYVLKGSISVNCGTAYTAEKDDIAFFPSGYPHSLTSIEPSHTITFMIPYSYFKDFAGGIPIFAKLDDKPINRRILSFISEANRHIRQQPNVFLKSYIDLILATITHNYMPISCSEKCHSFIIPIISYINENYKEKITLEDISRHFGYSKHYFSRLFNKFIGCNLSTYINTLRSSAAKESFSSGKTKKTASILESGFNCTSTFYRHNVVNKQS